MKRPPMLQPLTIDTSKKEEHPKGAKLEITATMDLVLSHDGGEVVVTESGVKKSSASASNAASPISSNGSVGSSGLQPSSNQRAPPGLSINLPSPPAARPIAADGHAHSNSNASGSGVAGAGGLHPSSTSGGSGAGRRVKIDGPSPVSSRDGGGTGGPSPAGGAAPESMLGQIAFDQLELLEILGNGSQGSVRKVRHKVSGDVLALKSVAFSSDMEPLRKVLVQELQHTAAIKHPNVVSSYEAYFRNGKMYFLMEFMDCGTCSDLIRRHRGGMTDNLTSYIARHMVAGMHHLHEGGVVHRDVKPANLLVNSQGDVKISDFGVAGDARNQLHNTNIGSTPYMSPERIKSQPYSHACDIWSIGITIAEIALGTYPFGAVKNKIFDLCEIIAGGHAQPLWAELAPGRVFDPQLIDFVKQCLLPQDHRPSAEQLMKHKFLDLGRDLSPAAVGIFFSSRPSAALTQQLHTFAHQQQAAQPNSALSPSGSGASPTASLNSNVSPVGAAALGDSLNAFAIASALRSSNGSSNSASPAASTNSSNDDAAAPSAQRLVAELQFSYRFEQFRRYHAMLQQQEGAAAVSGVKAD